MIAADEELDAEACVGTLRWKADKKFPALPPPPPPPRGKGGGAVVVDNGWARFLESRCGSKEAVRKAQEDLSLIDGLSFPVTIMGVLQTLQWHRQGCTSIDIVVLGATYKAEKRLWHETAYWDEVETWLRDLGIDTVRWHFVGPELQRPRERSATSESEQFSFYQGTASAFVQTVKPQLLEQTPEKRTLFVGFNPGFGSGSAALLNSWLPDLEFLADANVPVLFTQANDFSDLRGELMVLRSLLKCKFAIPPQRNPFHMAMTACEDPANPATSTWSCGNSFLYLICGRQTPSQKIDPNKISVCAQLLARFANQVGKFDLSRDVHITEAELTDIAVPMSDTVPSLSGGAAAASRSSQPQEEPKNVWSLD